MLTSEKTEYLPPIKSLCSTISASNLFAILIKVLSFASVMIIILFLGKVFLKTKLRFAIVSSVCPDLDTIIKQELFIFFIFLKFKYKLASKLSKKKYFFFYFFLKKRIYTFST